MHAYAQHEKAARLFGITSTVDLASGVARMAEWAQRVGARKGQTFDNIEIRHPAMPSIWQES
jgi:UDP-glucose 4-epimerase